MSQIISKIGNSLIETSGLLPCRKYISPFWQINSIQPIELHSPLIQTSKFLLNCQKQSAIGWDSWQPIKSVAESDRSDSISTDIHRFDDVDLENLDIVTNIVESFELESGLEISIFSRDNKLISHNKSKQDNLFSESQHIVSQNNSQIDRDNLTADNQLSTNLQLNDEIIYEMAIDNLAENVPLSAQHRSLNIEQTPTLSPQVKEVGEIVADVPRLATPDNLADEEIISEVEVDNVPLSAQSRPLNIEQTPTLSPQIKEVGEIFVDVPTPEILDDLAHEGMIREVTPISPSTVDKQDDPGNLLPIKGYATGGQVADSHNLGETIHPSDTVSAMLTPKEFVVNVRDAQKNINLLEHINSGRELTEFIAPDAELPVLSSPTIKQKSTAQDSTFGQSLPANSLQLKDDNSLIYPSRERGIDRHHISFLNDPLPNSFEHDRINRSELEADYSSPSLIFRKPQSSNAPLYSQAKDVPFQWENIEDLLTGNNDVTTIFNLPHHVESRGESLNDGNLDRHKIGNLGSSPNIFAKHSSMVSSFTNGGEVISPDLATGLEPITETVEGSSSNEEDSDNSQELEVLAHEIYHRLRQRLEVERERQGIYHGRLSW